MTRDSVGWTHMAVVGLCQVWHNDLGVSFCPHGARIQEGSLIAQAAAENDTFFTFHMYLFVG